MMEYISSQICKILGSEEVLQKWRQSYQVPIFKNKWDPHNCQNYRGKKPMSHCLKLYEKIMEKRLRDIIEIGGFMPGRSTNDAIHAIRQMSEKYREKSKKLHMVFLDLKKAFDRIPRKLI
ncbi:uncharacterized protein LOC135922589 [Gordionus sp. m RMFG-2023]|uniref:uncharacterized protein LOC135922589 n=1 Tax=Gordionus sp. m RMFG-2023 TaxID=3053472 RepID=UPI0031FD3C60